MHWSDRCIRKETDDGRPGGDSHSTPHGYFKNHFLRDVAKPVLEANSHAKVQMRRKVRGFRSIEQSLQLTLDAHANHPEPFVADDLIPYRNAQPPPSQHSAIACRRIMRKARSSKQRAALLAA